MAHKETVRLVSAEKAQTFSSGFTKREFKGETLDERYPQLLKFVLMKDKVTLIDGLRKGDIVDVEFFINGREVEKRDGSGMFHVMELTVAKLTPHGQEQAPQQSQQYQPRQSYAQPQQAQPVSIKTDEIDDDDIPF